jgi:hypothetical protein
VGPSAHAEARRSFDASSRSLCTFFARRERGNQWNVAVTCVCSCTVCTSPALSLVPGLPWVKLMFSAYLFVTVFFAPFDWRRKPRGGSDR